MCHQLFRTCKLGFWLLGMKCKDDPGFYGHAGSCAPSIRSDNKLRRESEVLVRLHTEVTSADCRPPFWGSMTRPWGYFGDVSRNFQTQTKPSAAIWRRPQWRPPFSSERRKGASATERGSTTRTSETCRSLNLEWNEVALELRAADLWQLGLSAWPLLRGVLIAFCPLHLNETMQRKRGEETPLSWVWGRIPSCQTSPAFRSGLFVADEF